MMCFVNCRQPANGGAGSASVVKIEAASTREAARLVCADRHWAVCSVARPGVFGSRGLYRLEIFRASGRLIRVEG